MRVIAGSAGRRKIEVPKSVTRPTTDRTREALFSMVQDLVKGERCLDLFAGSGALGIEALSRGAMACDFVEQDRGAVQTIKKNLKSLGLDGGVVHPSEVMTFLKRHVAHGGEYAVIFADPPYVKLATDTDFVEQLLNSEELIQLLNSGGHFVAESPAGRVAAAPVGWQIVAERSYGSCGVSIYRRD